MNHQYIASINIQPLIKLTGCTLLFAALVLQMNYSSAAEPLGCIIEPELISNVGSPTIGIIESVKVERGDYVRKGQVLATLRANIEKASVQIANTRSKAIADIRSAEAALKLAKITENRAIDLVAKKFISQQALDKAHAETIMSQEKLAFAKEQLNTANSELSFARAQLNERTIRAPFDGIIADRYIWPGERVEEKPLFRLAKINPLRVEMVLSAALYGKINKGAQLEVTPLLHNTAPVLATVVLVDQLIDGASNTFRIRAEIPNNDLSLPSGLRCKADIPETPIAQQTQGNAEHSSHLKTTNASMYQLKLDTQLGKTEISTTTEKSKNTPKIIKTKQQKPQ